MIDNNQLTQHAAAVEADFWRQVDGTWEPLYGNLVHLGVSIEWHDFKVKEALAWDRSFHEGSCELCLNWSGISQLTSGSKQHEVAGRRVMGYLPQGHQPEARRLPGERHCFITIEMSRAYIERSFAGSLDHLRPWLKDFLKTGAPPHESAIVEPMPPAVQRLFPTLRKPPVVGSALPFWYEGRILTLASLLFFDAAPGEEVSTSRQQRVTRDRTEAVKLLLENNLTEPPTMTQLGREVGCSAAYLGRLFAAETGMSVPQYLRKLRLQQAAELLREGTHNVTEAAFDVGYNSLSHFSKAFYDEFGCCPGLYPQGVKLFRKSQGS